MTTEVKDAIKTKLHVKFPDNTYCIKIRGIRVASLEINHTLDKQIFISDLTLEDIEKIAYDLLKIIEEERKECH